MVFGQQAQAKHLPICPSLHEFTLRAIDLWRRHVEVELRPQLRADAPASSSGDEGQEGDGAANEMDESQTWQAKVTQICADPVSAPSHANSFRNIRLTVAAI